MPNCNKCGTNKMCGCQDKAFTTIPIFTCPPDANCPSPEVCSEFTDANCVIYSGFGIVDININTGDRLNSIIQKLTLLATNPDCVTSSTCRSIDSLIIFKVTNTTILPQWNVVSTGINYQVEYKLATDVLWTLLPILGPTATTDTISGLIPSTNYYVRVNTFCSAGNCYSVTLLVKTLA